MTFIIGLGLGVSLLACGGDDTAGGEMNPADAKTRAASLVQGTAREAQAVDQAGAREWKVDVAMPTGGMVEVHLDRSTGALVKMESEKGPFDYDFVGPSPGFITFSRAKAVALGAKAGNVEVWELSVPKTQYEFYVRDANQRLFEIKMNAVGANITTVEEKAKPD